MPNMTTSTSTNTNISTSTNTLANPSTIANTNKSEPFEYPIGERIKFFREQKHISTNKLANLAGISQSYLRDIELGNKNPTIEIIFQLCKTLGISLKDFFDDDSALFSDDPLIRRIYRLTPEQRKALLNFLNTLN